MTTPQTNAREQTRLAVAGAIANAFAHGWSYGEVLDVVRGCVVEYADSINSDNAAGRRLKVHRNSIARMRKDQHASNI